jgi:transposase-like protein
MARRKFSEAEIIAALKRAEGRLTYEQVGRELGASKHTIYAWKSKWRDDCE